jgi:hypothetical protein
MPTHLLKMECVDAIGMRLEFGEPALETQKAHPAAFEALRSKALCAARDVTVSRSQRPTGCGAQIEGKNR